MTAEDIVLDTPPDEGVPAKDPTINVQNLLRAAIIRVDDLRDAETRRVNELVAAEQRRIDEKLALIERYERLLQQAEAKRIDAIRVVDINAVSVANERAAAQAQVLANQVAASADTLRALVATTAQATAAQFAQVTGQFSDRIAVLERSSYEGKGRESYTDPVLAALLTEVKSLRESQSVGAGRGSGVQASGAMVFSVIGAVCLLISVGISLFVVFSR